MHVTELNDETNITLVNSVMCNVNYHGTMFIGVSFAHYYIFTNVQFFLHYYAVM
jgi:hypothetical protein